MGSPPPCVPTGVASPFIEVVVKDRVPTTFTGLLSGNRTTDVAGSAVCGMLQSTSPVPIIVLHPTCSHPFEVSGSATVKIVGGPHQKHSSQFQQCNLRGGDQFLSEPMWWKRNHRSKQRWA